MRKILLAIYVTFTLPSFAIAETVEIQCKINHLFILKFDTITKNRQNPKAQTILEDATLKKWWQFWLEDKTLRFTIDLATKKAISDFNDSDAPIHAVEIHPDEFIIEGFYKSKNGTTLEQVSKYFINRINGEIIGQNYAPGNYWQPFFNSGEIMQSIDGKCVKAHKVL